ncbi:TfoX/Sxy family protein [Vibrio tubiashii]|uniref:TfoX/Sxy family DNA transformation protein n=1 Tax=Vibrio tubiashii TaxID=29498 RepID=UPI001EFD8FDE|nr:TfoX/Sxy family DNA transformation protein [Vibrio tubiashii]MCG9576114.1 TfoX/Sxy family protein [Vibrio tubiashii]
MKELAFLEQHFKVETISMFGTFAVFIDDCPILRLCEGEVYFKLASNDLAKIPESNRQNLTHNLTLKKARLDNFYRVDRLAFPSKAALQLIQNAKTEYQDQKLEEANNIKLRNLPNLRIMHERMLRRLGINSPSDLRAAGTESVLKGLIRSNSLRAERAVAVSMAENIEGAIHGVHASTLPETKRQQLRKLVDTFYL